MSIKVQQLPAQVCNLRSSPGDPSSNRDPNGNDTETEIVSVLRHRVCPLRAVNQGQILVSWLQGHHCAGWILPSALVDSVILEVIRMGSRILLMSFNLAWPHPAAPQNPKPTGDC